MKIFKAIVTDTEETHWICASGEEFDGLILGWIIKRKICGVEKSGLLRAAVLAEDTSTGATVLERGLSGVLEREREGDAYMSFS